MKRIPSLILVLSMLCLAGCGQAVQEVPELLEPVAAQPQMVVVERSDIFNLIAVEGSIVSYYEPVSFSVDGIIGQILVKPGQTVTAGQTLVVLDTQLMQERLEELLNSRQTMQERFSLTAENLELAVSVKKLESKALAQTQQEALTKQEKILTEAKTAFEKMKAAHEQEQAELTLQIERLRQELESLPGETQLEETVPDESVPEETDTTEATQPEETTGREEQEALLAELEAQLEAMLAEHAEAQAAAEEEIQTLRTKRDQLAADQSIQYRLKDLEITEAKNALTHARKSHAFQLEGLDLSIDQLREEMEKAVITAPFDGRITWVSNLLVKGSAVTSEDVLLCVSDPTRLSVWTERISSNRLEACDRIVAAAGDQVYALTPVAPSTADDVSRTLNGLPLNTVFTFTDESNLPTEKSVLVLCRYLYREDVLNIPVNALLKDQSGAYVYVLKDGRRQRVNVTVGQTTEHRVEIVSGLEEGDVVYAAD